MSESDCNDDRQRRAQHFLWIDRQTAVAIAKMILATNSEDDEPFHVRFYAGLNDEGQETLWLRLYDGKGPTTESKPCSPPIGHRMSTAHPATGARPRAATGCKSCPPWGD